MKKLLTFGFTCGIILYVKVKRMMINLNQKRKEKNKWTREKSISLS